MGRMVKATRTICEMCKFRSGAEENGCNYIGITGHGRIFGEDGHFRHDPRYCDRFERGKRDQASIHDWKNSRDTLIPRGEYPYGYNPYQE